MKRRSAYTALDERLGDAVASWIARVLRRKHLVVAVCAVITLAVPWVAAPRLGLNSNEEQLFHDESGFAEARARFRTLFPGLTDPVVIVVDGSSVDRVHAATEALRGRLLQDPEDYPSVYQPGGGPFFEQHGLLYLDTDDLDDTVDRLAQVQPYLGTLARDGSLRGFFGLLRQAADAAGQDALPDFDLAPVLDHVSQSLEAWSDGRREELSWAELLLGREPGPRDLRRLILVQPRLDFERLRPAEQTLVALRTLVDEFQAQQPPDVRVRITGVYSLSFEESKLVGFQSSIAGAASFVLVTCLLSLGLRSTRLVLCIVATLLVGLVWTAGFAALAIGHLNLISVTFAVLFIGLSVDFGIHVAVRYRDGIGMGLARNDALIEAGRGVGGSLTICSLTTAMAFFAFVPTDFIGIAELGIIAGTGMFVSLFVNLTLLPALLALRPAVPPWPESSNGSRLGAALVSIPIRHCRAIVVTATLAAVASLTALPRLHFDMNPTRVRDPGTESVQTLDDLIADGMAFAWNLNAMAEDAAAADRLAAKLTALPEVKRTLTLSDYVPADQDEKLAILDQAAFLLLPTLEPRKTLPPPSPDAQRAAIEALRQELTKLEAITADPDLAAACARLAAALAAIDAELPPGAAAAPGLARLQDTLLATLPDQLRILRLGLRAGPVRVDDLPEDLKRQTVTEDGRVRVEIFPEGDLGDGRELDRYVAAVRAVVPGDLFGEAMVIQESGAIVVRSFRQALLTAAVLVSLALIALWRNLRDAALVAIPVGLAALFTCATAVVLGVPFNFANVIVIPLLLGTGVDTGIHLVHRLRYDAVPGGNLLRTSTARAVLLAALTTLGSFGTLGFSTHRGMASLGRLLALGIVWILICNLMVLPAVVAWVRQRRASGN